MVTSLAALLQEAARDAAGPGITFTPEKEGTRMTSRMEKVDFMENRFLLEIYRMDERFERASPLESPRCSSVYTDGWIGKMFLS